MYKHEDMRHEINIHMSTRSHVSGGAAATVEVMPDTTIRQLKQQLKAIQACEDEFTRSVSRVDLVVDGTKLCDDGQTVTQAGLSPDTEVQVLFTIHTIECSSKKDSGYDLMDLAIVHIPSSATKINYGAFQDCTLVASVIIPDSVSLTIPNSVAKLGKASFEGCHSLVSLTIPDSVRNIHDKTFRGCNSLRVLRIPDSVLSIGNSAFEGCHSLTSLEIPSSVIDIGMEAFSGCRSLANLSIPNSVTCIWNSSFFGCSSLVNLSIPPSVTEIKYGAFSGCCSLESLSIPHSVTYIGIHAFSGCTALKDLTIPSSVNLGHHAFDGMVTARPSQQTQQPNCSCS
ncbi:unnamed protein product [Durusdinium trenchii]|uniref:Ubiquitin-like domain-containing protein n=1 Tax=Durusdinium trenchii TaxID=1381693 RepID=A0ABP0MR05_9DINO